MFVTLDTSQLLRTVASTLLAYRNILDILVAEEVSQLAREVRSASAIGLLELPPNILDMLVTEEVFQFSRPDNLAREVHHRNILPMLVTLLVFQSERGVRAVIDIQLLNISYILVTLLTSQSAMPERSESAIGDETTPENIAVILVTLLVFQLESGVRSVRERQSWNI